jgi:putative SOS response-associated peptidase YedK
MCGRYALKPDKQDIATAFYAKKVNPQGRPGAKLQRRAEHLPTGREAR